MVVFISRYLPIVLRKLVLPGRFPACLQYFNEMEIEDAWAQVTTFCNVSELPLRLRGHVRMFMSIGSPDFVPCCVQNPTLQVMTESSLKTDAGGIICHRKRSALACYPTTTAHAYTSLLSVATMYTFVHAVPLDDIT